MINLESGSTFVQPSSANRSKQLQKNPSTPRRRRPPERPWLRQLHLICQAGFLSLLEACNRKPPRLFPQIHNIPLQLNNSSCPPALFKIFDMLTVPCSLSCGSPGWQGKWVARNFFAFETGSPRVAQANLNSCLSLPGARLTSTR